MSDAVKHDRDKETICDFLDSKHRGKPSLKRGRINAFIQSTFLFDFYNMAFLSSGRHCECPSHISQVFQSPSRPCAWGLFLSSTASMRQVRSVQSPEELTDSSPSSPGAMTLSKSGSLTPRMGPHVLDFALLQDQAQSPYCGSRLNSTSSISCLPFPILPSRLSDQG